MSDITITEVVIPASLDADDAAEFLACVEVRNAANRHDSGGTDLDYSAEELLPGWQKTTFEPKRMLAARLDGRLVARGVYETRTDEAADTVWLFMEVLPEARGHGVGAALGRRMEEMARAEGKTRAIAYAPSWKQGGIRIPSPTGFGSVPAGTPEVRLLQSFGYTLEQVERGSRLPLPLEPGRLEAVRDEARRRAPEAEYRVHSWIDATPVEWREDIAHLLTRMSTDAPTAGLEEPEDVWTVERLVEDERFEQDSPRTSLTAAVEHVASGRLVGFTELTAPAERDRPASQEDTLVLREHRGHRLGTLLKAENLLFLERVRPGHPAVITYNAEENRHMLDVNEALGFVPFAYEGAWRKTL
ncbi:GNAT family N-acetyltransferase [Microcella daejeonensis]|uniref:GNAT family N-acetyltransferase n=1 Tax=Microcella daejeonensis TaxID=2994971 RepID=UPI00226DA782|nr:GNAT family N-acetyltransferase [Microcella daejeonensis]WAB83804.1 GNAT family N-acetyltransferase [Microcella daejeonensis]